MMRNLKVMGLTVAAVFAFAALSAAAASAAEFHSESAGTTLTAEQDSESPNQVFVTPAGTVTCKKVSGNGVLTAKTESEVTAGGIKYEECKTKTIFGEITVSVNFPTNECDYQFHANGEVDIKCGKNPTTGIIVEGPLCKITVPAQTGLSTVTYDNKNSGTSRDITLTANVTGISGTATGSFCTKQGAFTTGTYTGNVTIKGSVGGNPAGIWWE